MVDRYTYNDVGLILLLVRSVIARVLTVCLGQLVACLFRPEILESRFVGMVLDLLHVVVRLFV